MEFKNIFVLSFVVFAALVNASILNKNTGSCSKRCSESKTIQGAPCQCNSACVRYNDCCSDYYSHCAAQNESCFGRCDQLGKVTGKCQCNKSCVEFGDCCPDYSEVCTHITPSDFISDEALQKLGEKLISLDTENNAGQYIKVDLQGSKLLNVAPLGFALPTIKKLIALHNNFIPETSASEDYTREELEEISSFVDAVFNTKVMQAAQEFLQANNLPNGRASFHELWFGLYTRGNGIISSCGFEHVFVGEINSKGVSGFHNWVFYAREQSSGHVVYDGHSDSVDMGLKGSLLEFSFSWKGITKSKSSISIGTSPEFELAIYTVCFYARPDAKCPVSFGGNKLKIQTYTIGPRKQYVGSAYPDLTGHEGQSKTSLVSPVFIYNIVGVCMYVVRKHVY